MIELNELEEDWGDPEEETDEEGTAPTERMRIQIGKKQEPIRIDKFLMNHMEGATRNKVQQMLDGGFITVNGKETKANYKVRPNDEIIIIETRKSETEEIIPEEMPLNIVYEDDALMVINKPDGIVVHPGCGNYTGTLVNGLAFYLQHDTVEPEGLPRVGLVHRIDKDTSGLLLIAKTPEAMTHLAAQFKKHTVHRRYIALVWGDLPEDEGTIHVNVGRNLRFRKIMDTFPDGDHGKDAITHYKVLERFNYVTLVELRLETGRTHQIRIHMKSIGHPLFNDATYGGDHIVKGTVFNKYKQFVENCFKVLPRHALHAKELGFMHPVKNEWIQFSSELPEEMTEVIEKWRTYTKGMTRQLKEKLDNQ
ncbi:RluA family pseudouridine synthase [Taibaiella soli]|uniref:Pseudouridine synthase n=1 Tax=Taibaiella soli TaxID=1649169 RepID=A0A2W2B2I2_9BACT|nr:RluA family pseudouridine synthase [Taibaiella soli]PZF74238.1 RNA pseudouridine synthase [Taibaiella soli]